MNVLVTSAGRRVTLVQLFLAAAHQRGGSVFAGDMDALAPALSVADSAFRLPPISSPGYLSTILGLVEEHDVRAIVPTIDTELDILAEHQAELADHGCTAVVSSRQLIGICGDKKLTHEAFSAAGVAVPRTWLPGDCLESDLPEELVVKPREGSASQDVFFLGRGDVASILGRVKDPVIQERIRGDEITIDALLDLSGHLLHYVPRRRIRTLAGESIQGVTIQDHELRPWLEEVFRVIGCLGGIGPMTVQAFVTEGGLVLGEVNPRFGGGFPLAYAAGGLYPQWLLGLLSGERMTPRLGEYQVGLYMSRYNTETFLRQLPW